MALKQDIGMPCNICTNVCMGFKIHGWRKFCVDCKCSVENHDISDESTLSILDEMKLFDKAFYSSYQDSLSLAAKFHKSWLPIGLKYNEIDEFVSLLPNMCDRGSDERCRKRKLRLQISVTDRCVEKFCHLDTVNERQEAEKFLLNRNNRDIGLGYVTRVTDDKTICADCQITIRPNTLSVTIDNNSHNHHSNNNNSSNDSGSDSRQSWHPYCFKCTTCQELLVDFIYSLSPSPSCHGQSSKIYCIRHYAKTIRPRCGACDELIFSQEYIRANDEEFHTNHFACSLCDTSLSKQNYINHDDNGKSVVICESCYELKLAHLCNKCNKVISCNSKDVSYLDNHYHDYCFLCSLCSDNLSEKEFSLVNKDLFCAQCNRDHNLPRCPSCHLPIENNTKIVEKDDGTTWHLDCIVCEECGSSSSSSALFLYYDNRTICTSCFDTKFSKKCAVCQLVVRGGVCYQGLTYHRDCFNCCNCSSNIVQSKYIVKNSLFYCKACHDRLFASTCVKCAQLITAETGLKYVKFEDRSWHTTCFNCYKCNGSLVDKGFLQKELNVFCTQCGL